MSESGMKGIGVLFVVLLVVLGVFGLVWMVNSSNPDVPAGYVGYQTQGAWFGSSKFYGTLKGPASPGKTWMVRSFNVSITPYTYDESFTDDNSVLSKDNLKISFRTHIVWRVKEDDVKNFVEKYSTINPETAKQDSEKVVKDAYNNFLKEPFRTFSRAEVQQLDGMNVKTKQVEIGDNILAKMKKLTEGTPFQIDSVVVGNIQYPKTVEDAVSQNLAAAQLLEKEHKDAERRIVQAEGIAKSMKVINAQLTDQYLQHEAIEAQKVMVGSPNHTVIYIPVGPMGIPIVNTVPPKAEK
jgi:hypothetical protein